MGRIQAGGQIGAQALTSRPPPTAEEARGRSAARALFRAFGRPDVGKVTTTTIPPKRYLVESMHFIVLKWRNIFCLCQLSFFLSRG
jgi:hypothetical protein